MIKSILEYVRKNANLLLVILISAYAFYLRILSLYHHSLWTDELIQLGELKGTFWRLLSSRPTAEFTSFLCGDYYLMFPFFKIFSYNKWGLAIPHIIATLFSFYILYLLSKRYLKTIWGYLITFSIVCFNATLIYHATEIRPYAVLPTLALGTLYLLIKLSDSNFQVSSKQKIWSVLFFIVVIWFQVYGLFMYLSSFVFAVLLKYKSDDFKECLKRGFYFTLLVLGITMPLWLYCIFGPHHIAAPYTVNTAGTFEFIPNPLANPVGFLKGVFCNLIGHRKLYFLLIGTFIPVIFSYKGRVKQLLFFIVCVLAPIGIILITDLVSDYWFMQRQFLWVIPLYAFYLGWAWESLFIKISRKAV